MAELSRADVRRGPSGGDSPANAAVERGRTLTGRGLLTGGDAPRVSSYTWTAAGIPGRASRLNAATAPARDRRFPSPVACGILGKRTETLFTRQIRRVHEKTAEEKNHRSRNHHEAKSCDAHLDPRASLFRTAQFSMTPSETSWIDEMLSFVQPPHSAALWWTIP